MALSSQQYFIREKLPSAESLNYPVPGNSFVNGSNLSSFFFSSKWYHRISLTLSCPMNLKLYPLDRQMCSLLMISCKYYMLNKITCFLSCTFNAFPTISLDGWTTEDLVFQWRKGDPVQVAKNMHLPRFMLERYEADYCHSVTNTGKLQVL